MKPRKVQVVFFVGLIILTGVFKNHISEFFTIPVSFLIEAFGFSYKRVEGSLSFLSNRGSIDFGLGVLFYYGTYIVLHLCLIHFLFLNSPQVKKHLMLVLLCLVLGLGVLAIGFKSFGFSDAGYVTFYMFNQLVGRPLILFLVEGGGLIYESIEKAFEN